MDMITFISKKIGLHSSCPCERCNADIQELEKQMKYYQTLDYKVECINSSELCCDKCSNEDHEGYFCRCEDRNINLAKRLRETGNSSWKNIVIQENG